ncbi:hypothetical protein B0J15DRAFT_544619 [Fusarium solani]|uniref:BTB domain-containing protein n=2 Tax=Fusarium solani TaxID=169388 RepID=A0A9P9L028_FUSSL|nr:uncharacterized protein B0J15DRAFT_544619 [Fusarium solani]KAH7271742.1 hypothetical protein B0J15DRAFT_544619 [Fusarium solani]
MPYNSMAPPGRDPSCLALDPRPTQSPYLGTLWSLVFGNENYVWIHARMINKHPEFAAKFESGHLFVNNVPPAAAHIIIEYLYTGRYSGLKAPGNQATDQMKHDFKMAVHVCDIAHQLSLAQLENMASRELMALTPSIPLGVVIDLLDSRKFYQTTIRGWLQEYMGQRLLQAGRNATEEFAKNISESMKKNQPVTAILCQAIAQMGIENKRLRQMKP